MQLPGWLITVFYFFAALYPLVLAHELGHFLVAKLNGIRVDEFGLGFPPRALRLFTAGGTDYTLNWLPLGGFVRLHGEDDPTEAGAFAAAPPRARAAVLLAGPFANFLLTAVLLAVVGVVWGMRTGEARGSDIVRVTGVESGSPAVAAGMAEGDLIVAIGGKAPGTFAPADAAPGGEALDGLIGATTASDGRPLALTVVRGAGDAAVVSAPAGLALGATLGLSTGRLVASPAAGGTGGPLQANDLVIEPKAVADGSRAPAAGERLVILRTVGGAAPTTLDLSVTPAENAKSGRVQMGIAIDAVAIRERVPLWQAPWHGVKGTVGILNTMVTGLARMFSGVDDVQLSGPIGIARISREMGRRGLMTILSFAALLSANLGLINLFPIPGLDGGRLLFVALEAVRGRRVEPTREALVHALGIGFVLLLMLVITVMDVLHPVVP